MKDVTDLDFPFKENAGESADLSTVKISLKSQIEGHTHEGHW